MSFIDKINEYKDNIEALQAIDSMEVYRWMISLGQKLIDDPLSVNGRLPKNQVSYCQFELYVDWEDDRFKAYSRCHNTVVGNLTSGGVVPGLSINF